MANVSANAVGGLSVNAVPFECATQAAAAAAAAPPPPPGPLRSNQPTQHPHSNEYGQPSMTQYAVDLTPTSSSQAGGTGPRRRAAKAVVAVADHWLRGGGAAGATHRNHNQHQAQRDEHSAFSSSRPKPTVDRNMKGSPRNVNSNGSNGLPSLAGAAVSRRTALASPNASVGTGASFSAQSLLLRPHSSTASLGSFEMPASPSTTMSSLHSYSNNPSLPPPPLGAAFHRHSAGAKFAQPGSQHPHHIPHHHHHQQFHHLPSSSSSNLNHSSLHPSAAYTHPHHHPNPHSERQSRPVGSHVSLPVLPTASSCSAPAPGPSHRSKRDHHNQHHPSQPQPQPHHHHEPKYDADFDRGTPSRGPTSSAARNLFNPDAPNEPVPSSSTTSNTARRRGDDRIASTTSLGTAASTTSASASRKQRSKRDVVDPLDLGRRVMGESKDSIESEDSVTSGARSASRASKEGGRPRRSRRDDVRGSGKRRGGGDDGDLLNPVGSTSSLGTIPATPTSNAPGTGSSRQLFDPRRDDPVKFAQGAGAAGGGGGGPSASSRKNAVRATDSRSLVSVASSTASQTNADQTANETAAASASAPEEAPAPPAAPSENPIVAQLKRAYREIVELETKMQDENKAALAAMQREDEASPHHQPGVRIKGQGRKFDDEYWVKLASGHKQLADAHYSFLQMALDPHLPASLHSLPQKYNIPTRLWQTAFHQLLERMRHAVLASPPSSSNTPSSNTEANVMEHLVEFIQYAYGYYSQLFEDPTVSAFRSAWIEQLGDLARYRMAVAGLASRVSAAAAQSSANTNGTSLTLPASPKFDSSDARPIEVASIGVPALNDWDLEEQETWRVMARDWYGQGIAEAPGTGRLHHHLALLSKGDEMRGLYHYAKSLTATHPYVSARESILPLFEEEHQARRTQSDVRKAELFVHIHGMLFTKISLDDFDETLGRLLEKIREESVVIRMADGDWSALGSDASAPFGDVEWFMIGVINISALLQYGAEDGVLNKAMSKEAQPHPGNSRAAAAAAAAKAKMPQAIMINTTSTKRSEAKDPPEEDETTLQISQSSPEEATNVVKQLHAAADDDAPLVFRLAQRLTFSLLEHALRHPTRMVGDSAVVNPYIILILTFLGQVSQFPVALRHLERAVPWTKLVEFFNHIPSTYDVRPDAPIKLTGGPLPEDWCIRGQDWTGKHLFSRGFWKARTVVAGGRRDEFAPPPPIEGLVGNVTGATVESEMEALSFDLSAMDQFVDEDVERDGPPATASAHLTSMRWRRTATVAGWLARNVAGLDVDAYAAAVGAPRFIVAGALDSKLRRWAKEEKEAEEAERQSRLAAKQRAGETEDDDDMDGDSSDDEEVEDDENDSPTVRELKARRRHLKAVIRQARLATRGPAPTSIRRLGGATSNKKRKAKSNGSMRTLLKVLPGYTVLVFDTNILLSSMKLFRDLVEAEVWTIVVPLAGELLPIIFALSDAISAHSHAHATVITELDGLRRNESPLGVAASEAISYLEATIRTHGRFLKVLTSRGNYLSDLTIRAESINFASQDRPDGPGFSHDSARSMDDVILRAVSWQKEHFSNRIALLNPEKARAPITNDVSQVVLVTFDRNLRLKAKARGLDAADEDGMALMLEHG
ncbi:BZ3500_MvSof-1268-A1-R1_Chr9g10361 [Microbotryum saponariae]|uniref:BZ3500_MvSof-1268-A1-R1_Chr9g10361 protein n=1 Tax=Microbotryum saponariae TaxID=289078 RepID=A0A2X0M4Z7_9BASI|nr:BZ3501_MvSof-1269-A2-R1_Chr9g10111 [Microbotryum saponariae]SCZ99966.1 BZ3500_MvSof-1268-A1-R1_Chr9g10361 [Microbotryum saponariae]